MGRDTYFSYSFLAINDLFKNRNKARQQEQEKTILSSAQTLWAISGSRMLDIQSSNG